MMPNSQDRLPRIVCAFAAFFTLAIPALSIASGIAAHPLLVELATRAEQGGVHDSVAVTILDAQMLVAWILAIVAIALSLWTLFLARSNTQAGTLSGAGRIVLSLGLATMFSAFYLSALLLAAARLLAFFLIR